MSIGIKNGIFASSFQGMLSITKEKNAAAKRITGKKKASGTKKSLNYNPRELSGMLMGAKNAQSAAMVQARAKSKQAMLQRALASGQYSEKQVRIAIAHAKRIAECARVKVGNLKEEEQMRKQKERKSEDKILQQELQRRKRKHRNYEEGKIQAADRKYYEDQIRNTDESVSVTSECAVLELSGMGAEISAAVAASEPEMTSVAIDTVV